MTLLSDPVAFQFGAVMPTLSYRAYLQDRTAEAWRTYRSSRASLVFLYKRAIIHRRPASVPPLIAELRARQT